jgi:hypothetical protein
MKLDGCRIIMGGGYRRGPSWSCCRRAILFVGPAHDDPERVIRQRALQRLGLIPRCAHRQTSRSSSVVRIDPGKKVLFQFFHLCRHIGISANSVCGILARQNPDIVVRL